MRILLTGSAGMVGRNVLEHAAAERHTWLCPSIDDLDLRAEESLARWLATERPEAVIHCAGIVGGIQANLRQPVRFLTDNLRMGLNLLLAAHEQGIPRVLNLGSSCMYPRGWDRPLPEEAVLSGELEPTNEAYALAKITVGRLGQYLNRESGRSTVKTLIPCNLYGRWDHFDPESSHMIPAVIRKLHEAARAGVGEVELWGDGTARREFMYAGDLADCIHRALGQWETLPDLMNVGLGHDWSILDYYRAVATVVEYRGDFRFNLDRPVGMARKLVDVSRQAAWGWQPSVTLEDGLRRAYQFYLNDVEERR